MSKANREKEEEMVLTSVRVLPPPLESYRTRPYLLAWEVLKRQAAGSRQHEERVKKGSRSTGVS